MENTQYLSKEESIAYEYLEKAIKEVCESLPSNLELFVYDLLGYIHKKQRFQFVVSHTKDQKPNYIKDIIIYVENNNYIINYGDVMRELPITPNNALSIVHFSKLYFPLFNLKQ